MTDQTIAPKSTLGQKLKVLGVFFLLYILFGAAMIPVVMIGTPIILAAIIQGALAAMFSAKFARWQLGTGEYAQKQATE